MKTTTYRATATRDGRWWSVELHDLPAPMFGFTQGRDLEDAEAMARDAIATLLGVSIESVAVDLRVPTADAAMKRVNDAREAKARAARDEQAALAAAARDLTAEGVTQRDAARMLGLSHQRVSQILNAAPTRTRKPRKAAA